MNIVCLTFSSVEYSTIKEVSEEEGQITLCNCSLAN